MSDPESTSQNQPQDPRGDVAPYGEDDDQDYVDRSVIDFDPKDGLYAGTAVDGSTKIPGEHPDLEELGVEYHTDDLDDEQDASDSEDDASDSERDASDSEDDAEAST